MTSGRVTFLVRMEQLFWGSWTITACLSLLPILQISEARREREVRGGARPRLPGIGQGNDG